MNIPCFMALRDFANSKPGKPARKFPSREIVALDKAMKRPAGVSEDEFYKTHCPPLPVNHEPQAGEPKAVGSLLARRGFRKFARETYTARQWRLHRWAYCRLTEMVDQKVQTILNAVQASGKAESTLILFSSDHGDMDAAHRMEHKTALYEEAANIPLLAMWPGQIPKGQVDTVHLVSNGLDLLPTVCDYAGIKGASDPRGRSLRPLFEGKKPPWRKTLGVESEIGRMVVGAGKYKYIRYDVGGNEEQLLDLNKDPHETKHVTSDPNYAAKLTELRTAFDTEWFPKTN